ncbi:MAG: hypothetical protein HYY20_03655 [Candidatus Tectomicrobia bacterium]|uniref:DUF4383 domain-containing protein n=1 Tax=Tectimicrobiota bacterium TaxID=2528274 RepID=A0A932FUT4_UNCTE|nr:hypothetical protein [Candidatus Tectomicrobia bacterium]
MTRGAGGTSGGSGQFLMGLLMMCAGGYMLFQSITVSTNFHMGMSIFRVPVYGANYFNITSGMIFVPFMFGIGTIFYDSRKLIGWVLTCGSIAALVVGVISNTNLQLKTMSAFELMVMIVLFVGGIGMFLNSLRDFEAKTKNADQRQPS